jgi:hypothetical protein
VVSSASANNILPTGLQLHVRVFAIRISAPHDAGLGHPALETPLRCSESVAHERTVFRVPFILCEPKVGIQVLIWQEIWQYSR